MKIITLIMLFLSLNTYAITETYKGYGRSIDNDEGAARNNAIKMAIQDAKKLARYACWSQQGRGKLCGDFMIEVISHDQYYAYEAIATAQGTFVCHQDEECQIKE